MPRNSRLLALLAVLTIVFAACGGPERDDAGNIIESGTEDVFSLQVGDCFDNESEEADEIANVPAVPCAEPHDNEVYYAFDLDDGAYPGEEAISQAAFTECLGSFETYVGNTYEASALDISYLSPTPEGWDEGDQEVLCILFDFDFEKLSGTMKGSGV